MYQYPHVFLLFASSLEWKQVVDQKWYQDFVSDEQLDHDMLFEVMAAANHLGIKPLLELASLKVTFQMMDRNEDSVSLRNYMLRSEVHYSCFGYGMI
jgi:hypothetical protein